MQVVVASQVSSGGELMSMIGPFLRKMRSVQLSWEKSLTNERDFPVPSVARLCAIRHQSATMGGVISH
jgi:hypothetical protein